jgi:hypothetical protein
MEHYGMHFDQINHEIACMLQSKFKQAFIIMENKQWCRMRKHDIKKKNEI